MKVIEINSVCGTGSTGRIACQIADVVVQNGGDAQVAYGRSYYEKGCNVPSYRIGSDIDVKLHAGLSRITDRQGFYSKKATIRLVKYIRQYNPDIIHLHNIHGYYLHLPTLFNFLAEYDKHVVWTLHDCWAFTGHCAHFDFIGCQKWKTGCHHCPQKKRYPKSILLDQSKRNWEEKKKLFCSIKNMTIVTPSFWLAGLVKKSFLQKYPIEVIHNGIDLEVFKPTPSTWKEDHGITKPIVLACASKWDDRKGYFDILKLGNLLPRFQIVIVGLSPSQAQKIPPNIYGITRTENIQELVEIYSSASVFVNTTYEEVLGLVNLEALACGTPVATYDTGGSPECLDDICGRVVPKKRIDLLSNQIIDLVKKSDFKDSCRSRVEAFSVKNFHLYHKIYLHVLYNE